MANPLSVTWSGEEETSASLDALCDEVQQAIKDSLGRYGSQATDAMKATHGNDAHDIQRYINRTWDLTNSIAFLVEEALGETTTLTMEAGRDLDYAEAVEQGTAHSRPYPFFWIEVLGRQPAAEKDLEDSVLAVLADHERVARVA